jgi:hypothetical protein
LGSRDTAKIDQRWSVTVLLKDEVLDRLLLSKSFLEKIRYQPVAPQDRHTLAANIIAAHDAAELAIAAICDQLGCLPQKGNSYLMDYFDPLKDASKAEVPAKGYFRNLNTARNAIKHQGLFLDNRQWARVGETTFQHITKWCWDYLNESFTELDESALLLDANVKRLYDEAKQSARDGDYKTTLEKLALALSIVFEENAALRGFEVGASNAEDAIRVVGFGIHGNDFLALQQFLPRISRWGENPNVPQWKQSAFGHEGNWHENSAAFCLQTFVDVAIKLQGAQWIPGALSRTILYDQQITTLKDDVEFWRQVPDVPEGQSRSPFDIIGAKTRTDTKLLLPYKGEKLRVMVELATDTRGRSFLGINKDASTLSVTFMETWETWNVRAADVKVTCVPKDSEGVKQHFPWLPEIDWEPE